MKFKIGQRVRYVGPDLSRLPAIILNRITVCKPGGEYTIRGARYDSAGEAGYVLEEIVNREINTVMDGRGEPHFYEGHFRPLTDISVFTEMLKAKEVEPVS